MTQVAITDERGRVTLGKDLVDRYGRRFVVVPAAREIVLLPVPDDPLKALEAEGKKIPAHLTLEDVTHAADRAAQRDARIARKKRR